MRCPICDADAALVPLKTKELYAHDYVCRPCRNSIREVSDFWHWKDHYDDMERFELLEDGEVEYYTEDPFDT